MSISSETRRAGPFAGNGSTVAFPFTFKVFTTAQVTVTRTVSGVDTILTLTTNYTVTLNSDQDTSPGGTVTMLTAPATGQSITITSNVANLQPTVLANLGGFYPEVLNDSLDRATIQIQQLDERLDRALVIPVSSSGIDTELPVPTSGALIGWNPGATALQNYNSVPIGGTIYQYLHRTIAAAGQTAFVLPVPYTLGANALSVFVNGLRVEAGSGLDYVETNTTTITFTSGLTNGDLVVVGIQTDVDAAATPPNYTIDGIAALRLLNSSTTANHLILLRNYVMGDGGGIFRYDSTDNLSADNGGTIIVDAANRRWLRQYSGAVNVRWFGATGDGVTDDTAALNAAATAARTNGAGLFLPAVATFYSVTGSLDFTDIKIIDGRGAEIRGTYTNNAAVTIGGATSFANGYIWLAVRSTADKSTTAGNRGIVLRSMSECKLWLYARGFNEGIYFDGTTADRVWVSNEFNIIKLFNNTSHVHFDLSGNSYAVKNQFVGGGYYLGTGNIVANQGTFKLTLAGSGQVADIQVDNAEIGIDYGSWDLATQAVFVHADLNTTWNTNTIEFTNCRYEGYGAWGSNNPLAVHIATTTSGRLGVSVEIVGSVTSEGTQRGALRVQVPTGTNNNVRLLNKAIRPQAQGTIAYPQTIRPDMPIVYQTLNRAYIPNRILFETDYGVPVPYLGSGFGSNGVCNAQNNRIVFGTNTSSFGLRYEKGALTTAFLYLHKEQQFAIVCYDANGAVLSGTSPYYVVGQNYRSVTRGSIDIYECNGRWVWLHKDVHSFYIGPARWSGNGVAEDVAFDVTFGAPLSLSVTQPLTTSELLTHTTPTQAFLPAGTRLNRTINGVSAQVWDNQFFLKTTTSAAALSAATTIDVTTVTGIAQNDIIGVELDTEIATGLRRYHYTTVSGIAGSTLTLAAALPAAVASGRDVLVSRWLPDIRTADKTYDPPSLDDGDTDTTTVTVTGAIIGDFALASFSNDLQGVDLTAWISAADTVSCKFANRTGGTIDLASGTLLVRTFRKV